LCGLRRTSCRTTPAGRIRTFTVRRRGRDIKGKVKQTNASVGWQRGGQRRSGVGSKRTRRGIRSRLMTWR
jgi:hypothetical protein